MRTGPINRGTITRIDSGNVYVEVPALGIGMEFGPVEFLGFPDYVVGDRVLTAIVSGIADDVVVLGRLSSSNIGPVVVE